MLGPKLVNDSCLWTISGQNIIQRVKLYVLTNFFIGIQSRFCSPCSFQERRTWASIKNYSFCHLPIYTLLAPLSLFSGVEKGESVSGISKFGA